MVSDTVGMVHRTLCEILHRKLQNPGLGQRVTGDTRGSVRFLRSPRRDTLLYYGLGIAWRSSPSQPFLYDLQRLSRVMLITSLMASTAYDYLFQSRIMIALDAKTVTGGSLVAQLA